MFSLLTILSLFIVALFANYTGLPATSYFTLAAALSIFTLYQQGRLFNLSKLLPAKLSAE